jgi:hypothetical protein
MPSAADLPEACLFSLPEACLFSASSPTTITADANSTAAMLRHAGLPAVARSLNFTSWNQLEGWLRQVEAIARAA